MKLAIVTPSHIYSEQRARFARYSLDSLKSVVGETYPHIVVDSLPGSGPTWYGIGKEIYNEPNVTYIQYPKRLGGATALLLAIREARKQGFDLCFIHLDDSVYIPKLRDLLKYAHDAFERDEELMEVFMVGHPILNKYCSPRLGNLSMIDVSADSVTFEEIRLSPTRREDYTLWWSYMHEDMVGKAFWPIYAWMVMYRIDFLEKVLTFEPVCEVTVLGAIEDYYRHRGGWLELLKRFPGKLGYINMQFGGLEIHRNANWREIITFPNSEVR